MLTYDIASSDLGFILIAGTDDGVQLLAIEDTEDAAKELLDKHSSGQVLEHAPHKVRPYLSQVQDYLAGRKSTLNIPLNLLGSSFQHKVWGRLRAINYGETRTYRELANDIGAPSAVRAVARACATNSVALLVPCHRVIRSDGSLAGYRWGLERKKKLLAMEARHKLHS
jgi:O-6-methylguanine DNA methyltransferase